MRAFRTEADGTGWVSGCVEGARSAGDADVSGVLVSLDHAWPKSYVLIRLTNAGSLGLRLGSESDGCHGLTRSPLAAHHPPGTVDGAVPGK